MNDLFDFLGIEVEEVQPKKEVKKEVKKTEKKDSKSSSKKTTTATETVKFPVKVVTGYTETVTYQKEAFSKESVTAKDVLTKFASEHPAFPISLCGSYVYGKEKDVVVVFVKKQFASEKFSIKANAETKYLLGGQTLDLSAFMTDTECEIPATEIVKAFKEEFPQYGTIGLCYSATENTLIPCFTSSQLYGKLETPVNVLFWGHEGFTVTENDAAESVAEDVEDEDTEDAEEVADNKADGTSVTVERILALAEEHYPEFKGLLNVCHDRNSKNVILTIKESVGNAPAPKKEVLFPTDAEVSLFLHTKFQLRPEWFDGKLEITEDEFKKFLEDKYPEFSPERTYVIYDEKKKLIMPALKSSSKGALDVASEEAEETALQALPFPYVRKYEDGSLYRVERNPVANFRICMEGNGEHNEVTLRVPKIPYYLIEAARQFFRQVYEESGTEVMLQLFYNVEGDCYFWYLPKQVASCGAVDIVRNAEIEQTNLLVADFHSHGRFPAFWSATDCKDEKGTRFYGVMGSFGEETCSECYRVGCGGYYAELDVDSVFDFDNNSEADVSKMLSFLSERKERIGSLRNRC